MAEVKNDYYEIVKTDTDESHWTQFELDLINCIRDEYPIIYTKIGDLNGYQRAGKVRTAWKQISNKFKEIPMAQIKGRWKSLMDNYLKFKIYANSEFGDTTTKNKFTDGTLSFLEGKEDILLDYRTSKPTNTTVTQQDYNTNEDSSDNESYVLNIKDSLHEEVDLDDEVTVKTEIFDMDYGNTSIETVQQNYLPVDDVTESKHKPKKTWTEEELMNATRLTKEMIDQLIKIKTKNYYLSPVAK